MRYVLDIFLLLLLVFEMSFLYLPPFFHELVGAALAKPLFLQGFDEGQMAFAARARGSC